VAVGDGAVWALDADGRRLLRLAPATGDAEGAARLPGRPLALAVGPGAAAVLLAGGRIVRVAAD
jgi:streptogramin lyase